MYKISVIVPVHNGEKYIENCLESLDNQTLKDIEAVIINDGSTDNTQNIIDKFCNKNPDKFKSYIQKRSGVGAARNLGIKKSSSRYIGFVDCDDTIDPDMFKLMIEDIESNDSDVVICDYYGIHNGKNIYKHNGNENMFPTNLKDTPELLNMIDVCCWNKVYKKSLFNKDYLFRTDLKYEDFPLIPRILYEAKKITKIDKPLYNYLYNFGGETAVIDTRLFDILTGAQDLTEYFKEKKVSKRFFNELEYMMIRKVLMSNEKALYFKDKKDINKFLNQSFEFLNKYYKDWKYNFYFKLRKNGFRNKIHNFIIRSKYPLLWYKIHYVMIKIEKIIKRAN